MFYDNYENLANAVVIQAFKDYVRILKATRKRPRDTAVLYEKAQLERFFLGERLSVFTSLDGELFIEKAKKKVLSD